MWTRHVVQNMYLCRVEKIDGELYNSEFVTFQAVKDPIKETKKVANYSGLFTVDCVMRPSEGPD